MTFHARLTTWNQMSDGNSDEVSQLRDIRTIVRQLLSTNHFDADVWEVEM